MDKEVMSLRRVLERLWDGEILYQKRKRAGNLCGVCGVRLEGPLGSGGNRPAEAGRTTGAGASPATQTGFHLKFSPGSEFQSGPQP